MYVCIRALAHGRMLWHAHKCSKYGPPSFLPSFHPSFQAFLLSSLLNNICPFYFNSTILLSFRCSFRRSFLPHFLSFIFILPFFHASVLSLFLYSVTFL